MAQPFDFGTSTSSEIGSKRRSWLSYSATIVVLVVGLLSSAVSPPATSTTVPVAFVASGIISGCGEDFSGPATLWGAPNGPLMASAGVPKDRGFLILMNPTGGGKGEVCFQPSASNGYQISVLDRNCLTGNLSMVGSALVGVGIWKAVSFTGRGVCTDAAATITPDNLNSQDFGPVPTPPTPFSVTIEGSLDTYKIPNTSIQVQCVVVAQPTSSNPCAAIGLTLVSQGLPIGPITQSMPTGTGQPTTIRLCPFWLTAMIGSSGVNSQYVNSPTIPC